MKNVGNVILKIVAFILFAIAVSIIIFWNYKVSDERINDCVNKNGYAVTDFYGFYEKCIIEVKIK